MRQATEKTYSITFNIGDLLLEYSKENHKNGEVPNEISLPFLQKRGFGREEILKCFFDLEEKGFAKYVPGHIGKGNGSMLVVNEKCPMTHTVSVTVKRITKRIERLGAVILKSPTEGNTDNQNVSPSGMSGYNKSSDIILSGATENFIKKANRKPIKAVPSKETGFGYVCTFGDGYVFLDHVSQAGYNSPLEAVENVWEELDGKVSTYKSRVMSDSEQVTSTLMGRGFLKLEGNK